MSRGIEAIIAQVWIPRVGRQTIAVLEVARIRRYKWSPLLCLLSCLGWFPPTAVHHYRHGIFVLGGGADYKEYKHPLPKPTTTVSCSVDGLSILAKTESTC